MQPRHYIQAGCGYNKHVVIVASLLHEVWRDSPFTPESFLNYYKSDRPEPWRSEQWKLNIVSVANCAIPGDTVTKQVCLSAEGHVIYLGNGQNDLLKIPGAGIFSEDARPSPRGGYMSSIKQIGDSLFAVGSGSQIYRSDKDRHWSPYDGDLQHRVGESDLYIMDICERQGRLYFVANEGVYMREGDDWIAVEKSVGDRLYSMYVDKSDQMWVGGKNGLLLKSSGNGGFQRVPIDGFSKDVVDFCEFKGELYLATSVGLRKYNGISFPEVVTDLYPPPGLAHYLTSIDGVLWSIGPEEILRFDGVHWERLPPITAAEEPE